MFDKKKCKKCNSKIKDKFDFCPYCGTLANENSDDDFGMLGKNDFTNELDDFSKSIFGGIGGNMINKMFGNAMKMLEKEMQKEMKNQKSSMPKTNFQMFINGKKINFSDGNISNGKKEIKKISNIELPQNKLKNFSKLKKENPKTNIRRFSNKIVYEIDVPGVKSVDDISITKLENSIEIKAVSKTKAYSKIIPINLPIINYGLENQKVFIELESGS